MNSELLTVQDLSVSVFTEHGKVTVVNGVSLEVGQGEVLGLVGESGCGKTMMALSLLRLQMNVRSSTRATSAGSERQRKLFGRSFSFSLVNVPLATISEHSRSYSSCEPSHQCTLFGVHRSVMRVTQSSRVLLLVSRSVATAIPHLLALVAGTGDESS